ncbi:MAG TPA: ankyrin repeat domain-containing protein [Capsulimonadaceae bacterium]|jgi:ankyrin repeat protein
MADIESFETAIKQRDTAAALKLAQETPSLLREKLSGGLTPLTLAAYNGAWELVRAFTELSGINTIGDAVLSGDLELVTTMLDGQPELLTTLTVDGFTLLHLAAYFGKDAIALDLISRGADVNAYSSNELHNKPLHAALAGQASDDVIESLLKHGAAVTSEGATPLQIAAQNGRDKAVALLIAHGADQSSLATPS